MPVQISKSEGTRDGHPPSVVLMGVSVVALVLCIIAPRRSDEFGFPADGLSLAVLVAGWCGVVCGVFWHSYHMTRSRLVISVVRAMVSAAIAALLSLCLFGAKLAWFSIVGAS